MKVSKWVPCVILASASLCLTYCGKPILQASHSQLSEQQAQADLELRLTKTEEVKAQIKGIRQALEPVEALLHDLGKAVHLKLNNDNGISKILDRLQGNLRESLKGMIEMRGDGSWVLERRSPLADLEKQESRCTYSRVRLEGKKIEGGEEITILASGCSSLELEPLAVVRAKADGNRDVTLTGALLEDVHHEAVNLEPCKLKLEGKTTDFRCKPMKFVSGSSVLSVDKLEFSNGPNGTSSSIHAELDDPARGGHLALADLNLEPNRPASVRVCTRGEPCEN
jgi:hypothetical protein